MAKLRNTSRHQAKRLSTVTLVFAMLFMLTLVLLMLLALGILSLPVSSDDSPPMGNRINFGRKAGILGESESESESDDDDDGLGKRGEQWTEIISWEPRAFIYRNFLVTFFFNFFMMILLSKSCLFCFV
ncbi:hypothetical protein CsSME_00036344 [Camellia sinensis var. sinensis]